MLIKDDVNKPVVADFEALTTHHFVTKCVSNSRIIKQISCGNLKNSGRRSFQL